jgi:hypothetical protein
VVQTNSGNGVPYEEMLEAATALATLLRPACECIEIAGSVRRQKGRNGGPGPNDIEIVVIPRREAAEIGANQFDQCCGWLLASGVLEHRLDRNGRKAWGSALKRAAFIHAGRAYAADLFAVLPPAQWGVILALRTGPADFSRLLVTHASLGGACPWNRKVAGGRVWNMEGHAPRRQSYLGHLAAQDFLTIGPRCGISALDIPEEEDFFRELQVPLWPAKERTLQSLQVHIAGQRR